MESATNIKLQWNQRLILQNPKNQLLQKWLAKEDSQAESKTMWYLLSMVTQGVFFLPIPAYLI